MNGPQPPGWIGAARAVCRHELRLYRASPLTYVFLAVFSAGLAAAVFLVADFYATDDASLRLLRVFLPWVALALVPALAMRSWVDDHGDRGLELTASLPLPAGSAVAGKFLAGVLVLLVALACTAAFPATVAYLGEPDIGTMAATYLGAALFLATAFAICLMAAALTRETVSGFLAGLTALALATVAGWDLASRFADGLLGPATLAAIVAASPMHWFGRIAEGHVEPAAVFYFVAAPLGALTVTALLLRARRDAIGRRWVEAAVGACVLLAGGVSATMALQRLPDGIDLTGDGDFTLGPAAERILREVPEGTLATVYWSAAEPAVPAAIKSHARRVESRLRLMARASGGRLTVALIDPRPDTEAEFAAREAGVFPVPLSSGERFFLGVTATAGGRTGSIPYLDPQRGQLLDYDLLQMLDRLGAPRVPRLGLLGPLVGPRALREGAPGLSVLDELRDAYDVAAIPHFAEELPADLDVLLVLNAAILRTEMLRAIDAHVMRGGGLVVLLDPHMRSHLASNEVHPVPSEDAIDDISDLLLRWGLRYLGEDVVGDAGSAAPVMQPDQTQIAYPYWLRLGRERLAADHPVTAGLTELLLAEAGGFALAPEGGASPLVATTDAAGTRRRGDFTTVAPQRLAAEFEADGGPRVLAAVLGADLAPAFPDTQRDAGRGSGPVFALADADWAFDAFSVQEMPAGGRVLRRPLNDNAALLLNMVEFAAGGSELIAIRSRGRGARPFTRVETMMREAQARYRTREAELVERIAGVEETLAQIPAAAGVASFEDLPTALRQQIDALRRDLLPLRRELRGIRLEMREEATALGHRLTAINLAAGPALVLAFALLARLARRRAALEA